LLLLFYALVLKDTGLLQGIGVYVATFGAKA
jgi:hypothetical protein